MEPEVAKAPPTRTSFDKPVPFITSRAISLAPEHREFTTGGGKWHVQPLGSAPLEAPWPEPPFALQCA